MKYSILRHDWAGSTSDEASRLAREGAAEGTVVVAEGQRAGRGRLGRSWESPHGVNLYASIILRPAMSPPEVQPITRMTADALQEVIASVTQHTVTIKEPNDLMIDGKKVAGILTESSIKGDILEHVIVGFGVNVNMTTDDFPLELQEQATSLRVVAQREFDREPLLQACLESIATHYRRFVAS